MNRQEAKKRIVKLTREVNRHRYLYHVLDQPEISDGALDSLKNELERLEKEFPDLVCLDSPSQRVGGQPLDKFSKVSHFSPILSLADAFDIEDIKDWQKRNEKILGEKIKDYYLELKLDGLTVVLTYQNGVLQRAATRGDGKIGEDVTINIKTINSVPLSLRPLKNKKLPAVLEVRGEVVMNKDVFEKLNKEQASKGLPLFANPRNVAAGSIRQLDSKVTASRNLDFIAFEIISDLGQKTHFQVHQFLEELGFKTSPYNQECQSMEAVEKYLKKWEEKRKTLPYQTDGAVIVVNDIGQEKALGHIGKAERWMLAYKFSAEQATSQILDIELQVGRSGALTPVAILRPVLVAGTTVSRATLHNQDEIKRLDARIGDTVIIQKAGDIIPDIVEVIKNLRTGKEKPFYFPKKCPICQQAVAKKPSEVAYYCQNKKCYGQNVEKLIHFVSKKAFNIEGLGKSIVRLLAEKSLVSSPFDFFTLKTGDLEALEGFARKKADNLVKAISQAREINLSNFIYALGIRHVGEETSQLLARHFGSLKKISQASQEELMALTDIGPEVASSLFFWWRDNQNIFSAIEQAGIKIKNPVSKNRVLMGKTFIFTGSLSMEREKAKNMLRLAGAKILSSVSKNLDYLVIGENPGSKLTQAKKINKIKIISEEEFLKLLNKNN